MRRLLILVALALVAAACSGSGSTTTTQPGGTSPGDGSTTSTSAGDGGSTTTVAGGSTTTVAGGSTTTVAGGSTTTVAGGSTTTVADGSTTTTSADSSTTTTAAGGSTTTTAGGGATTTTAATPPPTTATDGDQFAIGGVSVGLTFVCSGGSEEGTVYRAASGTGDSLSLFIADGEVESLQVATATGIFVGTQGEVTAEVTAGRLVGSGEVFSDAEDEVDPVTASFDLTADPGACAGLRGDGIVVTDFGKDGDAAVAELGVVLGPPIDDSGWLDATDNACKGTVVRFVIWEDAFVLLTDAATEYGAAGTRHFAFWGAPEGTALASDDGIQPGVTTFGDVADIADPEFDELFDLYVFEIDGILYEVEAPDAGEPIIGASAGDRNLCGE